MSGHDLDVLNTCVSVPPEQAYYLTVSNANANAYNKKKMEQLDDKNPVICYPSIQEYVDNEFPHIIKPPLAEDIEVKNGMQVMFTVNDKDKRWFNGDSGILVRKSLDNNNEIMSVTVNVRDKLCEVFRITQDVFVPVYNDGVLKIMKIATVGNLPIRVAWAMSIYKSQSWTLPVVYIDYENFGMMKSHGLAYTSLSRVRHINDLFLHRSICEDDIYVSPNIIQYYAKIKSSIRDVEYDKNKDL
jgi:hypothetical protein